MKRIILIGGRAGSGKNTVAEMIKSHLATKNNKAMIVGNGDKVREYARKYFKLADYKGDSEGRKIMIGITDMMYDLYPNYFEKATEEIIEANSDIDTFIVCDWRYPCTHEYFKNKGYKVHSMYLKRGNYYNYSNEVTKDKSEQEATLRPLVDYTMYNQTMTLAKLRQCVDTYVEVLINGNTR